VSSGGAVTISAIGEVAIRASYVTKAS
jgi:hypothetical protein